MFEAWNMNSVVHLWILTVHLIDPTFEIEHSISSPMICFTSSSKYFYLLKMVFKRIISTIAGQWNAAGWFRILASSCDAAPMSWMSRWMLVSTPRRFPHARVTPRRLSLFKSSIYLQNVYSLVYIKTTVHILHVNGAPPKNHVLIGTRLSKPNFLYWWAYADAGYDLRYYWTNEARASCRCHASHTTPNHVMYHPRYPSFIMETRANYIK